MHVCMYVWICVCGFMCVHMHENMCAQSAQNVRGVVECSIDLCSFRLLYLEPFSIFSVYLRHQRSVSEIQAPHIFKECLLIPHG